MNTSRKLLLIAASAIAVSAVASSALAQNTSSASTTAAVTVISPIHVSVTGTLNFGRVVLDGSANAASLVLNTGDTTVAATNAVAVAGTTVSTPSFKLSGQTGQAYDTTVTPSLIIGGSNRLTVTGAPPAASVDLTTTPTEVPLVYTLAVPSGTTAGTYSGTVTVAVAYE